MTDHSEPGAPEQTDPLQGVLTDLIAVSMLAKHAHWNVVGPSFRGLHQQLDELADTARGAADTVAERATSLGLHPDGRLDTVAAAATPSAVTAGAIRDHDAARLLTDVLTNLVDRVQRASTAFSLDPVSQGILLDVVADLDKQTWLLGAHTL